MSKSRRASSPGSIRSGHRLCRLEKARNERETLVEGRVRLLEAHICTGLAAVNRVFCNFVAVGRLTGPRRRETPPAQLQDNAQELDFKLGKLLISHASLRNASGALNVGAHRIGLGFDPLHPVLH